MINKVQLLQEYKERSEQQLKQSVDELKYEFRVVREKLKIFEREKLNISNKLISIESKYNEAKENFKNAEEVLTSTTRMMINCSVRGSHASETFNINSPENVDHQNDSSLKLSSEGSTKAINENKREKSIINEVIINNMSGR